MIFLAAAFALFVVFYLIGSLELRGKNETRSRALAVRTIAALVAALLLTFAVMHDPLGDQSFALTFMFAGLTALLAVITLLDIETKMLSDALTVILALGGLASSWLNSPDLADMLPSLALAVGLGFMGWFLAGPYSRWRKQEMLGWGDVKFFAAAGLWLLPLQLPLFLALAGLIGTINAVIYRVATGHAQTPFAPALCAALWLCVVYGLTL